MTTIREDLRQSRKTELHCGLCPAVWTGPFHRSSIRLPCGEIKEYYYTTTFGSRVAGGVYETLLDGMELDELAQNEGVRVFATT